MSNVKLRPLFRYASNGQVRVQLKAEKAGQAPDYRLASFSVNQTQAALAYDANGSLLNLPAGLALAYDAEGNLATVSSNGTAVTENWYDAAGRRIAKRENGVLTLYVWEGLDILATADASGSLKEYYTRGPGIAGDVGSLIAEHRFNGATVFLHGNHRGDVVLVTDDAGTAVGRYEYTAFGMPLASSGTYAPRFGFSSKERDASGLAYYGFRFHSPELCRWITPDPIREDGGLNLYEFCGNDPVDFVDPIGLILYVSGSSEEKASVFGAMQQFINGLSMDGKGYCKREKGPNDNAYDDMISKLIDSPNLYVITKGPHSEKKYIGGGRFDPEGWSGGTIWWDTTQPKYRTSFFSGNNEPETVGTLIAHELVHAGQNCERMKGANLSESNRKLQDDAIKRANLVFPRMNKPLKYR